MGVLLPGTNHNTLHTQDIPGSKILRDITFDLRLRIIFRKIFWTFKNNKHITIYISFLYSNFSSSNPQRLIKFERIRFSRIQHTRCRNNSFVDSTNVRVKNLYYKIHTFIAIYMDEGTKIQSCCICHDIWLIVSQSTLHRDFQFLQRIYFFRSTPTRSQHLIFCNAS